MQAFLAQHMPGKKAMYRLVDKANWFATWSPLAKAAYVTWDETDLSHPPPGWWDELSKAQLIVAWYVHETLQKRLSRGECLAALVSNGAALLVGNPDK